MSTTFVTPNPSLSDNPAWYKRLGFEIIEHAGKTFATDGQVLVEFGNSPYTRSGLKFYNQSSPVGESVDYEGGSFIQDPNGIRIYFENTELDLNMGSAQKSILGNYGGISIECHSFKTSLEFWKFLGFEATQGSEDAGWICLKNKDDFMVSLMKPMACPHLFINPSLTYFNGGNNPEIIDKVRELEIPVFEEINHFNPEGVVDNIILQDKGGAGIFVFND